MDRSLLSVFAKATTVLLVVISLLTVGFAHRPVLSDADLAQAEYLDSLGLTAADLCVEPGEDGNGMEMGDCPACHLVASVLLPVPFETVVDIELRTAAVVLVPAQARTFARATNPATPVRAPPLA